MKFEKYSSADGLPDNWDEGCTDYFQKKAFLSYAEKFNPCQQRYYILYDGPKIQAGACVYKLKIDLFTYSGLPSPVWMTVVGVPASVSCSGLIGQESSFDNLLKYIFRMENGIVLALNLPPNIDITKGIRLRTLPGVEMHHSFPGWEDYVGAMRSSYRRRIQLISQAFSGISAQENDCSYFSELHYNLYLQVWRRSKTRLEKLTREFFSNLPGEFSLTSYYDSGNLVAWHIILKENQEFAFFFGGTDYSLNRKLKTYYNNLSGIVKEAIEGGYRRIDLGQTAEIAKIRFGACIVDKTMIAYHRNPLARMALKLFRPILEYHRKIPEASVFRDESRRQKNDNNVCKEFVPATLVKK